MKMTDVVRLGSQYLPIVADWFTARSASKSFWRIVDDDHVLIATSLALNEQGQHKIAVPPGDADAKAAVRELLRSLYPKIRIESYNEPTRPLHEWDRTVVLIGGGQTNVTTRWLLAALSPPWNSFDHEYPPHYDYKGFQYATSRTVTFSPTEDFDTATVIRAPNPFFPRRYVFILVGAYPEGTLGAATWALNTQNLKWLRKQLQRNRLNELAAFQAPSNSVQLMLRVPRMSPASKSGIPSIGAPQVYHHTGSPHAYFFNAPSGYRKDYRTYTNTLDGDN